MKKIALIGNPNVGKSTVFNALTGLHQHTGNWPGKTVENAYGDFKFEGIDFRIFDLPGTYSLSIHSKEEEVAKDFILEENYDCAIVVCDAVCLERGLILTLQVMERFANVVLCVNLIDEARKKKIHIDLEKLEELLGIPVVFCAARDKMGLDALMKEVKNSKTTEKYKIPYSDELEENIEKVMQIFHDCHVFCDRYLAISILTNANLLEEKGIVLPEDLTKKIANLSIKEEEVVSSIVLEASRISSLCVSFHKKDYDRFDRKLDKLLTSKWFGIPFMILMLFFILWLTIEGSNVPSSMLFSLFSKVENVLFSFFTWLSFPSFLVELIVHGMFRTMFWVVAVMLPPMAIFFPLFTILEDAGILPRIAFNLDHIFCKCRTCGKQALTMCMGFGCNAVGVTGCRIIDSKRERMIAILTNVFVPCNGRFPTILSMVTMFFVGFSSSFLTSVFSAVFLSLVLLLSIGITFLVSYLLSKTLLKGYASSFTLEMPPYRKPQFGKVIVRSIFDRTLFVLGRAVAVAFPAGGILWLMANLKIGDITILQTFANLLDNFGTFIGLDGMILVSFLLGLPANEIIIPILLLGYLSLGNMTDFTNLFEVKEILISNGWTFVTAINFLLLTMFHFPCSTTLLTIHKETNSLKWTVVSFLLPTLVGLLLCFFVQLFVTIF